MVTNRFFYFIEKIYWFTLWMSFSYRLPIGSAPLSIRIPLPLSSTLILSCIQTFCFDASPQLSNCLMWVLRRWYPNSEVSNSLPLTSPALPSHTSHFLRKHTKETTIPTLQVGHRKQNSFSPKPVIKWKTLQFLSPFCVRAGHKEMLWQPVSAWESWDAELQAPALPMRKEGCTRGQEGSGRPDLAGFCVLPVTIHWRAFCPITFLHAHPCSSNPGKKVRLLFLFCEDFMLQALVSIMSVIE